MVKRFTRADGFKPEDLMHSGIDHIGSAEVLFQRDPSCYDSAGYLAHLGLELILKGMHLFTLHEFQDSHELKKLYDRLQANETVPPLGAEMRDLLARLSTFGELRYPKPAGPVEIGSDDLPEIRAFARVLLHAMPKDLLAALEAIVPGRKGGRILLRKRKETDSPK